MLPWRGDHSPDKASAYLSPLALPWGDWQISHRLPPSSPLSPVVLGALTVSGGSLSMEDLKVTPLPIDLPSGCTSCWYGVTGQPGGG